jgi:hypothetical protein
VTLATLGAAPLVDRLGWSAVNAWAAIPLLVMVLVLGRALQRRAGLASPA